MRVHANSKDRNDDVIEQSSDNGLHGGFCSQKNASVCDGTLNELRNAGEGSLACPQQQCATVEDGNLDEGISMIRAKPPLNWESPPSVKGPVSVRLAIRGFGLFRHLHNFQMTKLA